MRARVVNADGEEIAVSSPVGLASRRTPGKVTVELVTTSSTPVDPSVRVAVSSTDPGLEVEWQTSPNGHDWE